MAGKGKAKDDSIAVEVREDIAELDRAQWNALTGGHPFVSYEFFHALHSSGCASRRSGRYFWCSSATTRSAA
jgi:predicted N-acyltransferase